jgi:nucleoside-diphosphate-sugar epimerase
MSKETGPINIGNPVDLTIKQFAEAIIKITESKSQIGYKDLPEDDPKVRQPDYPDCWGGNLKSPFEKGILNTVAYLQGKLKK